MIYSSYYVMIPVTLIMLNLLVIVHELGHFFVARWCGIRTPEFSVGFGPLLAKWGKKDVQYSIRAIPLGGFVKIAGMDIALEGAETSEYKDIPKHQLFNALPLWKKLAIIIAGPFNNLVAAFISLILITVMLGIPYNYKMDRAVIGMIEIKSPAYESGLMRGDQIVSIDNKSVKNWDDLVRIVHASSNKTLHFTVLRDGKTLRFAITPFYDPHFKYGRIGIQPAMVFKKVPFNKAVTLSVQAGLDTFKEIIIALGRLIIGKERPVGMGPIGMVGMMQQAAETGLYNLLILFPMFNIFLGLFNLLPIPLPLLDGGWVTILCLEKIRGKEFSPEQKAMAQMVGLGLFLLLFVLITYGDIATQIKRAINIRSK